MPAQATRHARFQGPFDRGSTTLPDLVGAESASLVIRRTEAERIGPPAGSIRIPAFWVSGRYAGRAEVTVLPLWTWGGEVHLRMWGPSAATGRLAWPARRLEAVAAELTDSLRRAIEGPEAVPQRSRALGAVPRRRPFVPATGSSSQ